MPSLDGVFVSVTTPFRGDYVAVDALAANLARWNAAGLAGYLVLGSTGEFPMLSEVERDGVLATAREVIPRQKAFIAGTGTDSTLHTVRQKKRAAELGAEVALVVPPHSFGRGFGPAAQVRHFLAVAEASPIPIVLHNVPVDTGMSLEPETVARIAAHPNVCGLKDSSGDIARCAQIIDQTPKSFHVLIGAASALLPALAIGAAGGILALGLIAARELCLVYGHARAGRWEEARAVAARMLAADRGVPGRHGIGGLKAARELQGVYRGAGRART